MREIIITMREVLKIYYFKEKQILDELQCNKLLISLNLNSDLSSSIEMLKSFKFLKEENEQIKITKEGIHVVDGFLERCPHCKEVIFSSENIIPDNICLNCKLKIV